MEIAFLYNIELDELQEIASEEKLKSQDLFDAIQIIAVKADGTELKSLSYECA